MNLLRKIALAAIVVINFCMIASLFFLPPQARSGGFYYGICVEPDSSYTYCGPEGSLGCILPTPC